MIIKCGVREYVNFLIAHTASYCDRVIVLVLTRLRNFRYGFYSCSFPYSRSSLLLK